MSRIIISYALAGMALAMLVGGVLLVGHAFKTFLAERSEETNDAIPPQDRGSAKPQISRIPSASSMKSAAH